MYIYIVSNFYKEQGLFLQLSFYEKALKHGVLFDLNYDIVSEPEEFVVCMAKSKEKV